MKEIKTGNKTNRRFRAAESVQKAPLGPDQFFQFLYQDGDKLVLMHNTTFEQVCATTSHSECCIETLVLC